MHPGLSKVEFNRTGRLIGRAKAAQGIKRQSVDGPA